MRRFITTIAFVFAVSILVLITVVVINAVRTSLTTFEEILQNTSNIDVSQGDLFKQNEPLLGIITITFILIIIGGFVAIYVYRSRR